MTPSGVFNGVVDFLANRTVAQWKLAGLVASVGLVWALVLRHDANLRADGYRSAVDSATQATANYAALRLHAQKDSTAKVVAVKSVTLTRILQRTDTLLRQIPETIVTHDDTVRAIQGLPALRLSTDSAIRACSDFQDWFARYRTVCDSLDHARTDQIAALRAQLAATKPSRWQSVLKWVEIGAAGYGGFRIGKALR